MAECAFLVEVGTEEMPPKALPGLARGFHDGLIGGLKAAELSFQQTSYACSPRRLIVQVKGLADRQPDRSQRRLGPALSAAFDAGGEPTRAAQGFAASCGIEVAALEREDGRIAATQHIPGQEAARLLPGIVGDALEHLPVPKRMRWGDGDASFVRPVRWLVMLLDADVVACTLFGVRAGRHTHGHRFHTSTPIEITHAADDFIALLASRGHVRVNDANGTLTRWIADSVREQAARIGGVALGLDDGLPGEVAALVEWPVPVIGTFDEKFLALPPEVLVTTLQHHQRYFPVAQRTGGSWSRRIASLLRRLISPNRDSSTLLPRFITFANLDSTDPDRVRHGNERVVTPRLEDAAFHFERDRAVTLASRIDALDAVVFQRKLGSLGDKRRRLERLASMIARRIDADATHAARAAALCKCDLLTGMVNEFPELQGTMGGHYARLDGEAPAVADAIAEHYRPRHAGDALPDTGVGRALALADRLDTLAGAFAVGARPTGDRDPFALRRAMIGVLRILVEDAIPLDLRALLEEAVAGLPDEMHTAELAGELFDFGLERLRAWLAERGTEADVFAAVSAVDPGEPLDFVARIHAVEAFRARDEAAALAAANKRITNILRQAGEEPGEVDPGLLEAPEERALYTALAACRDEVGALAGAREYARALHALASLRPQVDAFFDAVMVMADDAAVRANRLALLASLRALFLSVADIGELQ